MRFELFDTFHIVYTIISLIITVGLLIGFSFIKNQKWKDRVLTIFAVLTVVIHISTAWTSFFINKNGTGYSNASMLFLVYPCNLGMWLLLVCALLKKDGKAFKWFAPFTAYLGFLGAIITAIYPDFYVQTTSHNMTWDLLKSFLSHNTMLVGSLWLFVGGYVKIRVSNIISFMAGILGTVIIALLQNGLFAITNCPPQNAMYLLKPAIDGAPLLSGYFMAGVGLLVVFAFTVIYEFFAYKKEERWYHTFGTEFKEMFRCKKAEKDNPPKEILKN